MTTGRALTQGEVAERAVRAAHGLAGDAAHFYDALARIARGRTDNGRPLAAEDARQLARNTLIFRGYNWSEAQE